MKNKSVRMFRRRSNTKRKLMGKSTRKKVGVSCTVTPRSGPGTGVTVRSRVSRTKRRLRANLKARAKIRVVAKPTSTWKYTVFFHSIESDISYQAHLANHEVLKLFIKTSFSGIYKIVKTNPRWYRAEIRVLNYVKISEESDLFTLMLCHANDIRKIFQTTEN